jgi:hypothetical protein
MLPITLRLSFCHRDWQTSRATALRSAWFSITAGSSITATSFNLPPHAQRSMSRSNTRLGRRAQFMRTAALCSCLHSPSLAVFCRAGTGTTFDPSLAFGASTPCKRMRCRRGLGTNAASRCINAIGICTKCVAPLRHGVLSLSTTLPSRLTLRRSLEIAGRVM